MDLQIFKKCKVLGEYQELSMSQPYVKSIEEQREFYKQHKESIDRETIIYGTISNDRKKLGGDNKIHKI